MLQQPTAGAEGAPDALLFAIEEARPARVVVGQVDRCVVEERLPDRGSLYLSVAVGQAVSSGGGEYYGGTVTRL
jgi:hypothetical protein